MGRREERGREGKVGKGPGRGVCVWGEGGDGAQQKVQLMLTIGKTVQKISRRHKLEGKERHAIEEVQAKAYPGGHRIGGNTETGAPLEEIPIKAQKLERQRIWMIGCFYTGNPQPRDRTRCLGRLSCYEG